jgi:hypothetical protein
MPEKNNNPKLDSFKFPREGPVEVTTQIIYHNKSAKERRHCTHDVDRRDVSEDELLAKDLTLRVTDAESLKENFTKRFIDPNRPGRISLEANRSRRPNRRRKCARKISYRARLANKLLAADAVQKTRNTIKDKDTGLEWPVEDGDVVSGMYGVFGRPMFDAKDSSWKTDIAFLAKIMPVFLVDEDFTSLLCSHQIPRPFSFFFSLLFPSLLRHAFLLVRFLASMLGLH